MKQSKIREEDKANAEAAYKKAKKFIITWQKNHQIDELIFAVINNDVLDIKYAKTRGAQKISYQKLFTSKKAFIHL